MEGRANEAVDCEARDTAQIGLLGTGTADTAPSPGRVAPRLAAFAGVAVAALVGLGFATFMLGSSGSAVAEQRPKGSMLKLDFRVLHDDNFLEYNLDESMDWNVEAAFDHFVAKSGFKSELSEDEAAMFKGNFVARMEGLTKDVEGTPDPEKWLSWLKEAAEDERPVSTDALEDRRACMILAPFKICNRSLGLQYSHTGLQQCQGAKIDGKGEATLSLSNFNYTPNRKGTHDYGNFSNHIKGVVVVHCHRRTHSDLLKYIQDFEAAWRSWEEHLLTDTYNPNLAVLFVMQAFTPENDAISLDVLQNVTGISPLVTNTSFPNYQFELLDAQGRTHKYSTFKSKAAGRLVLATFELYPDYTNDDINAREPVRWADGNYIYGTNWYAFQMMRLPFMDFVDAWFKIDLDITMTSTTPDLIGLLSPEAVFMHTGIDCEPDWVNEGIYVWIKSILANESERCHNSSNTSSFFVCKNQAACANPLRMVYYTNFVGGAMRFWQSPEVMRLASNYEFYPDGMWVHRWTDQQWFWNVVALFFDQSLAKEALINDQSFLRDSKFVHDNKYFMSQCFKFNPTLVTLSDEGQLNPLNAPSIR
jgi:hypothetical protein